jgi:hypothetical protein
MTTTPPSPPSPPELQYEDSQRFRDHVHSINFGDDDSFEEHMFERPAEGPQPETPRVVPPTELQRRARDYPPLRGTGGGKGKGKGKSVGHHEKKEALAEHEEACVDSVRQTPNSDIAKVKGHTEKQVGHGECPDDSNFSDDGEWSAESGIKDDADCIVVVHREQAAFKEEPEKAVQGEKS